MNYNTRASVFRTIVCDKYNINNKINLCCSARDSLDFVQRFDLLKSLNVHRGCVNSLCWNERGDYLLSGSDDQHLVVTHGHNYKVLHSYRTSHKANIFSARFMPNSGDNHIISCSGDGVILYTDLSRPSETFYNHFLCHSGTTYEIVTIPNDPNSFISCGEDGTVRWFDLRVKTKCKKLRCMDDVMITCRRPVTALCVNHNLPFELAVGCSDGKVRTFDRRVLGTSTTGWTEKQEALKPISCFMAPYLNQEIYRITSLSYSPDAQDILVSYSSDYLYLFGVKDPSAKRLSIKPNLEKHTRDNEGINVRKVRKLRLRGDWSDTGPDARPEREAINVSNGIGQARPQLQATLMQRMTDVLTRMLNDPQTRAALSGGGENSLDSPRNSRRLSNTPLATSDDSTIVEHPVSNENSNNQELSVSRPQNDQEIQAAVNSIINETQQESHTESSSLAISGDQNPNTSILVQDEKLPSTSTMYPTMNQLSSLSINNDIEMVESNLSDSDRQLNTNTSISNSPINCNLEESYSNVPSTSQSTNINLVSNNVNISSDENIINEVPENENLPSVSSETNSLYNDSSLITNERFVNDQIASTSTQTTNIRVNVSEQVRDSSDTDVYYSDSEDEPVRNYNFSQIEEEFAQTVNANNIGRETYFDETETTMPDIKTKFTGHRNARTMIKEATFYGNNYVMSGSDCGHIFVWDRQTANIVMLLQGDQHVVNCIQPHPTLPLLATSGIDYDVKLWAPIHETPMFDANIVKELTERNEIMLEETRDTITVPASFMIRMLACLNQIRRGGARTSRFRQQQGDVNAESN